MTSQRLYYDKGICESQRGAVENVFEMYLTVMHLFLMELSLGAHSGKYWVETRWGLPLLLEYSFV